MLKSDLNFINVMQAKQATNNFNKQKTTTNTK